MSLPSILPGYLRILIYACAQPGFVSHCALALASWSSWSPSYTCVRVCIACHTACWLRLRRGSKAAVALFKSQRTCESLLSPPFSSLYPQSWLPLSDLACCSPVNRNAIVITRTASVPPPWHSQTTPRPAAFSAVLTARAARVAISSKS